LPISRRLLPRNLPGKTYLLRRIHLEDPDGALPRERAPVLILDEAEPQPIPLLPVDSPTGRSFRSGLRATEVDFLAKPWILTADPAASAAENLWLFTEYAEVDRDPRA
jgi:hypothetical protein